MKAGDIIKKKRIDLGLTQSQLGDLAGFSQQAIAKFESGERTIDENKIYVGQQLFIPRYVANKVNASV